MKEEEVGDLSEWSEDDIRGLWEVLNRLRKIAEREGWEEEFLNNVKEWANAGGKYPIDYLRMRRRDWQV